MKFSFEEQIRQKCRDCKPLDGGEAQAIEQQLSFREFDVKRLENRMQSIYNLSNWIHRRIK